MPAAGAQRRVFGLLQVDEYVPAAIADGSPAYRQGLGGALARAGFTVEEPADVSLWVREEGPRVLSVGVSTDEDLAALACLSPSPRARIVALLADASPWCYRSALETTTCFPVARDAPLEDIVAVVGAAVGDQLLLPFQTARDLVAGRVAAPVPGLESEELVWLGALAAGTTVARLATAAGYSEREMYRRLNALYRKMQATSRVEAVVNATLWGLLPAKNDEAESWGVAARQPAGSG